MRFKKSIKNLVASWIGQSIYIFVNLILRKVFVNSLGEQYLGISGLFTNVLSILSLAELGVGTAINYSLYVPLAENRQEEIKAIMNFYKKVYRIIGSLIFLLGLLIMPFLKFMVLEINEYENIYSYYLLFLCNTAISYFWSYKATLIIANQKKYIQILNHYFSVSLMASVQILFLAATHNYVIFLSIQICFTLLENINIAYIADKMFPYLKEKSNYKINADILAEIKKNTFAMLLNSIGTKLVTATDNIIISKYIGLAVAGIYSNYAYVIGSVGMVFTQIYGAIQASIGNFGVCEEVEKRRKIYRETYFAAFVFYSLGVVCLVSCVSPFIKLWLGNKYILSEKTVYLIIGTFYIAGLRQANIAFISGFGLFWQIKWKALLEGTLNFTISILMVQWIGLDGIFVGTIISAVIAGWMIEPYVLFHYGLKDSYLQFIKTNSIYLVYTVIVSILVCNINNKIVMGEYFREVVIRLFIGIVLYVFAFILVWRKNAEYRTLLGRVRKLLN